MGFLDRLTGKYNSADWCRSRMIILLKELRKLYFSLEEYKRYRDEYSKKSIYEKDRDKWLRIYTREAKNLDKRYNDKYYEIVGLKLEMEKRGFKLPNEYYEYAAKGIGGVL